jgi:hypothetical protein
VPKSVTTTKEINVVCLVANLAFEDARADENPKSKTRSDICSRYEQNARRKGGAVVVDGDGAVLLCGGGIRSCGPISCRKSKCRENENRGYLVLS